MRKIRFTARIKPGRILRIPPGVIKRLGLDAGSKINCRLVDGRIELTKVLPPDELRLQKLRERLRTGRRG